MEMAVADFPLLGMRTKMIVSVLVASSSPARSVASSSSVNGLPGVGAAVHAHQQHVDRAVLAALAERAGEVMWLIPDSNDRIGPTPPVPTTIASATDTAMARSRRAGISPGYLRDGRRRVCPACQTQRVEANRDHRCGRYGRTGLGGSGAPPGPRRAGADVGAVGHHRTRRAERFVERGDVVINCAAYTKVDAAEADEAGAHAVNAVDPRTSPTPAPAGAELIHISPTTSSAVRTIRTRSTTKPVRSACTAAPSSAVNSRCWPRCPTRTWSAVRGSTTAATAATSWRSCAGWRPATDRWMWWRPDRLADVCRRPTARCFRWPTAPSASRCCTPPTGRGQPVRAGAGGVRRGGRRPAAGAPGRH